MFYVIDFDTRQVESKSEDSDLLAEYILENDLSMAVALVGSEEDLCLEFTLRGLNETLENLAPNVKPYSSEEEAAEKLWAVLNTNQVDFPTFTPRLGKKLLKEAAKRYKDVPTNTNKPVDDKPKVKLKPKAKSTKVKPRFTTELLKASTFVFGPKVPRESSRPRKYYDFIDENLGEATFQELIDAFDLDLEESDILKDLKYSLQYDYLCIQIGE